MPAPDPAGFTRRERQIMDALYREGGLSAARIQQALPDPPGYSAVRAMLRTLEEKGHLRHEEKDLRYVYFPAVPKERAKKSAAAHLLETFFQGSVEQAVAALLEAADGKLSRDELARMARMIAHARKEGR